MDVWNWSHGFGGGDAYTDIGVNCLVQFVHLGSFLYVDILVGRAIILALGVVVFVTLSY